MPSRILFSAVAAATLLAAAPALAGDKPSQDECSCCSDGSVHESDHRVREQRAEPAAVESPDVRNQSWGG